MVLTSYNQRRQWEQLDRPVLARLQLERLNRLLAAILPQNHFYAEKLRGMRLPLTDLAQLATLPWTLKSELIGDAAQGEFAANLTYPLEHYVRFHRTSGTRGRPLAVLDTADDWQWWVNTWQFVLDAAEIGRGDHILMAFSFGPFIGFWSAYDAAAARGAMVIPSGGLSTPARLELARAARATAVFCTPSYALRMAEVAAEQQVDLRSLGVRALVVAGEPGGSAPAMRRRIEGLWGGRVVDHCGASEVGPWGYATATGDGLHVCETEFIAEFLARDADRPAGEGELAELVLTTLGRYGSPVIRYRTGDLVRPFRQRNSANRFVFLAGGVLGRADDMLIIRGVNVFPGSVEEILRGFEDVVEYRLIARREGALDTLTIEVEDRRQDPARIAHALNLSLGLRVDVQVVPIGALPRFEGKAQRYRDERSL